MSSRKLKNLKIKLIGLINRIDEFKLMLPGNYGEVYLKCGKKNCWCFKSKEGHSFRRITWSDKGKGKTKAIPENDVSWIKKITNNYRIFRKKRQKLFKLVEEYRIELNKLEMKVVAKTREKRNYL